MQTLHSQSKLPLPRPMSSAFFPQISRCTAEVRPKRSYHPWSFSPCRVAGCGSGGTDPAIRFPFLAAEVFLPTVLENFHSLSPATLHHCFIFTSSPSSCWFFAAGLSRRPSCYKCFTLALLGKYVKHGSAWDSEHMSVAIHTLILILNSVSFSSPVVLERCRKLVTTLVCSKPMESIDRDRLKLERLLSE